MTNRLMLYMKTASAYSENFTKQLLVHGPEKMDNIWMTKQVVHVETIALYHVFRRARILAESAHYVRVVRPLLHRGFREIWYWRLPCQSVDVVQIWLKSGKT